MTIGDALPSKKYKNRERKYRKAGMPESGGITAAFSPLPFRKGGNGGGGAFSLQNHR